MSEPTTEGCIETTWARSSDGYGRRWVGGRHVRAHRYAWEMANGPVPDGLAVLHHCDNPPCVNPAHLFLGTLGDNNKDRARKGRTKGWTSEAAKRARARSSGLGNARLTPDTVEAIRLSALSQRQAATVYGCSQSQVGRIRRGESWWK